ncbi:MAG: Ferredoxin--NADP reductase [bacterium]|nr:Ferredoxin--NADP reductase [bacterium]
MLDRLRRYTNWLHTQWPSGGVERLPVADERGRTPLRGVYVVGDLTGVPLLKFALDSGVKAVREIASDKTLARERREAEEGVVDVAILGAGVSGFAAAVEAKKRGLSFVLLESAQPLSTLVNFPKAKPIYTYPLEMRPAGDLQVSATVKEGLITEIEDQIAAFEIRPRAGQAERIARKGDLLAVSREGDSPILARRVIVAIGRSGNHRKLGVPGEDLDKVYNRLHDPKDFKGKRVLVVGGGDSALETAIALSEAGAEVSLSHRRAEFTRPKPENVAALETLAGNPEGKGSLRLFLGSEVRLIREKEVLLSVAGGETLTLSNEVVFVMIGREAPLDFFRRCGIPIQGELGARQRLAMGGFLLLCVFLYLWKSGGNPISALFVSKGWFPYNLIETGKALNPSSLFGTVALSMTTPSFYYGLAYSLVVTGFGIRRIRRRKTPYITVQTWTLIAIQVIPLFLLPTIVFPWLGHNGLLPGWFEDAFFPRVDYDPHGREYWRAAGFVLAWPLFIYNVFTDQPLWAWLVVAFGQTFVLIPALIYFYGKGAYCGWICSCGALAETLGDSHRSKMPHGPGWNRLNMAGQAILAFATVLLLLRILGWLGLPFVNGVFHPLKDPVYKYGVDIFLSGILGVGLYFWYSGRVWCRFFCPLAALMHIYARFSRFRILSEKKKCISCGVCTSVCHQGIDVMNFANKGRPMEDPECVRCSACVHSCPTGVLSFGQADRSGRVIRMDRLAASPVQMREGA